MTTDISFCIVTSGNDDILVQRCIDNIAALNIPQYEIVYCGGQTTTIQQTENIKHIPFDETINRRWITRKKNMCVQAAYYEICVVMHDYILFDKNWYIEFQQFGTRWDICVHQTLSLDGNRTSGWRIHKYPGLPLNCMIPYDIEGLEQFMPIQGNYCCIKKTRYLEDPQNEEYIGYVPSDMEWSRRIVPTSSIRCNPNSIIYEGKKLNPQDIVAAKQAWNESLQFDQTFQSLRNCRISNWMPLNDAESIKKKEYI